MWIACVASAAFGVFLWAIRLPGSGRFHLPPIDGLRIGGIGVLLLIGTKCLELGLGSVRQIDPACARCRYPHDPAIPRCPECGHDWRRPRGTVTSVVRVSPLHLLAGAVCLAGVVVVFSM